MGKLENELERLDKFLVQLDRGIGQKLKTDTFDTQDLLTLMGVRDEILKRIENIQKEQRQRVMWKDYKNPTPNL
jgi:hypothetical protein